MEISDYFAHAYYEVGRMSLFMVIKAGCAAGCARDARPPPPPPPPLRRG